MNWLELHDTDGNPVLINLDKVLYITKDSYDVTEIYLNDGRYDKGYVDISESYEDICETIFKSKNTLVSRVYHKGT